MPCIVGTESAPVDGGLASCMDRRQWRWTRSLTADSNGLIQKLCLHHVQGTTLRTSQVDV